jgi:ferredoxin
MEPTDLDPERLRKLLGDATGRETIQQLMALIPVANGTAPETVAKWYGFETETVREWLDEFGRDASGAFDHAERFGKAGRRVTPTGQEGHSHVEYLDYEVIAEHGWELGDSNLFEKARTADLEAPAYGGLTVEGGDSVLEAVEAAGLDWPHACRGGACSNCAVIVKHGEISMPGDQILPGEAVGRGARLACVGTPVTDHVEVVYNVDELDFLEEYRLPSRSESPA